MNNKNNDHLNYPENRRLLIGRLIQCLEAFLARETRGGSSIHNEFSYESKHCKKDYSPARDRVKPQIKHTLTFKKRFVFKLVRELIKRILLLDAKYVRSFIQVLFSLWYNMGYMQMIKYMKTVRIHITQYIAGNPKLHNSERVSLKDGFPTKFLFLKALVDTRDRNNVRKVLTLLNITRGLDPLRHEEKLIKPKLSTITDKYTGVKDGSNLIPRWFIERFVKDFGLMFKRPVYTLQDSHYISLKGGPGGKSSAMALETLVSLTEQQLQ